MEPLGYARVARRWWWLIAGLVIAALVIVFLTTPSRLVNHYEATHVLLVEAQGDSGNDTSAKPEVVALWAQETEVLDRAAAAIGDGVDAEELRRDIEVATDRNVDTVSITATDRNPDRAELKADTVAQETIAYLQEQEAARSEQALAALAAEEEALRAQIAQLDGEIAFNPPDVDTRTAERDALIRQLGSVLEEQANQPAPPVYSTIDDAQAKKQDRLPGTRSRAERMLLAGGVALVLGFGLALTLDRSDTRIRSRRRAEEHFGLPAIAEVVKFPFWMRRRHQAVVRHPTTAVAESYRTLRSALMLRTGAPAEGSDPHPSAARPGENGASAARRGEAIMIASSRSNDGKSTTVANLAAAYGESGLAVLVLTFDMRRVRRRRARVRRAPGVTEYLATETPSPLSEFVSRTDARGVSVVGLGNATRPPGGQLGAQRRLLDEARALADVVIVDSAPLPASSINRELATMVDGVVALCRVGRTTAADAEQCGDLLAQLGAPALGVVMVGSSAPEGSDYFSYFAGRRDRRDAARANRPPVPRDVTPAREIDLNDNVSETVASDGAVEDQ